MNRRSCVVAVLAPFVLASCDLLAPGDAPLANLPVAVSDSVVISPSLLSLNGRNTTGEKLLYNPCFAWAQRLESGVWSPRSAFPGVVTCSAQALVLPDGANLSFSMNVQAGIPPGTYRAQLRLVTEDDRETYAVSTPFWIQ